LVSASDPQSPLNVQVLDEVNDGETLNVLVAVSAKIPWPAQNVLIKLSTLMDGEEQSSAVYPVERWFEGHTSKSGATGAKLMPGEEIRLALAVPIKQGSDYQLEVLWGQEAQRLRKAQPQSVPGMAGGQGLYLGPVQKEVRTQVCAKPPCAAEFLVRVRLINGGPSVVQHASLGVGFMPRGAVDFKTPLPQNEETVELKELRLLPGQAKTLKLSFDRALSQEQIQSYEPVVRILSYE
jgi:hypothetical protein